jgi:hypothetical protein
MIDVPSPMVVMTETQTIRTQLCQVRRSISDIPGNLIERRGLRSVLDWTVM